MKNYNDSAILKGFSESDIAVDRDGKKPVEDTALCLTRQIHPYRIRQVEPANRAVPSRAFFIAASDAKANAPGWVSCTGYTGHIAPYASLANLVEVLHNLLESKRHIGLNVE